MRCPKCDHTQQKKAGEKCQKCHYRFVLLPREAPIHDYKLMQLAKRLSVKGQYYPFTRNQLITEVMRAMHSPLGWASTVFIIIIAIVLGLLSLFLLYSDSIFWGIVCGGLAFFSGKAGFSSILARTSSVPASNDYFKASDLIKRYMKHHPIPGLVDGKALEGDDTGGDEVPAYLQGISPEAILVVERNDLVDALVKARFHMQHKIAVVSQFGYPHQVFVALPGFVQAHPNIPILVAHDASHAGLKLVDALRRNSDWAFAVANLKDIGLSIESFEGYSTRLPWINAKGKLVLSRDHQQQLDQGSRLALDSFRPRALSTLLATTAVAGGGLLTLSTLVSARNGGGSSVEGDFG